MNKYFLDENNFICEISDKDPTKSRELLKFQACERLNELNNKVSLLERRVASIKNRDDMQKSKINAETAAKIEILQDVKSIFKDLSANDRAKIILGYIDKKIELLTK